MAGVLSDQFKRMNLQTKTVGEDRIKKAKDRNEDVAVLSMELPGEKKQFRCCLGEDCSQGDPTSLPLAITAPNSQLLDPQIKEFVIPPIIQSVKSVHALKMLSNANLTVQIKGVCFPIKVLINCKCVFLWHGKTKIKGGIVGVILSITILFGTKKMEYKTRQWHEKCFCCNVCKVPIGTQSFIPREQEIYCAKCYEEKFATRCIKCNKVITSGGVTYKNEPWHRECFTCTNCQKSLAGERFTSRDEKPFCAECFGELFAKRCTACNKPITGIGGTKFISFEDRHWHNDCFFCASCRTSLVGHGFITDQEDIICPECAKQKLM